MQARINYFQADPETAKAILGLSQTLSKGGLEHSLMELVKVRASQINGCGFCVDMHYRDARKAGESEQRLAMVAVWQDSSLFSDRERAALAWTEALTLLSQSQAPDHVYEKVKACFSDSEIVKLTAAIGMINFWNRLNVGLRMPHPVDAKA